MNYSYQHAPVLWSTFFCTVLYVVRKNILFHQSVYRVYLFIVIVHCLLFVHAAACQFFSGMLKKEKMTAQIGSEWVTLDSVDIRLAKKSHMCPITSEMA